VFKTVDLLKVHVCQEGDSYLSYGTYFPLTLDQVYMAESYPSIMCYLGCCSRAAVLSLAELCSCPGQFHHLQFYQLCQV
jgi:hypothetical protein